MGQTNLFRQFQKRINELEGGLPAIRLTGNYTRAEQDAIRAFRLLVHAECEAYLEEVVMKLVNRDFKRYSVSGKPSRILSFLTKALCQSRTPSDGKDRYEVAVKNFQSLVKKNHGVKEQNICRLILSIGVDESVLNTTWLATMDSFGLLRGVVAHSSAYGQAVLDPTTEKATTTIIVSGLQLLDQTLQKL